MADNENAPAPGGGNLLFRTFPVVFMVFCDTLCFGVMFPFLPRLLMELTGKDLASAGVVGGALIFLYAGAQFLSAPVLGRLSDAYGRRLLAVISLAALSIDYWVMAETRTLVWLMVTRLIAGIFSGNFIVGGAYIADVTDETQRARGFGQLGAAWGAGFIVGPLLGSLLISFDVRTPFVASAILSVANLVILLLFMKESLRKEHRRPMEWRGFNPLVAFAAWRSFPHLGLLLATLVLLTISTDGMASMWAYFPQQQFGWGPTEIAYSLAYSGVLLVIIQMGLVGKAVQRLGERRLLLYGLALTMVGIGVLGLATRGYLVFVAMPIMALGSMAGPCLRSLLSQGVGPDRQGELQGLISSITGITAAITPVFMMKTFDLLVHTPGFYLPGGPYIIAAILVGICLLLVRIFLNRAPLEQQ